MSGYFVYLVLIILTALPQVVVNSSADTLTLVSKEPSSFSTNEDKYSNTNIKQNTNELAVDRLKSFDDFSSTSLRRNTQAARGAVCNLTEYAIWQDELYEGILSTDSSFWRYQKQKVFKLRKSLALELAVAACQRLFYNLKRFRAGRWGPVTLQNAYDAMCSDVCVESDNMHLQAMKASGCSCIDLSTKESQSSYVVEGDWCRHNSGMMVCKELGFCGVWECDLADFHCPRLEWNRQSIPLRGPGSCISDGFLVSPLPIAWILSMVLAMVLMLLQ